MNFKPIIIPLILASGVTLADTCTDMARTVIIASYARQLCHLPDKLLNNLDRLEARVDRQCGTSLLDDKFSQVYTEARSIADYDLDSRKHLYGDARGLDEYCTHARGYLKR
jgi:hypothetical protein